MSLADNYVPVKELGNGATTIFTGAWNPVALGYLRVYLEDILTGVQTPQAEGADFTSALVSTGGFRVTFNVAPSASNYVVVGRQTTPNQTVPYKTSKGFDGSNTEQSYDKLTAIAQELGDEVDRSLKFKLGTSLAGVIADLPVDGRALIWSGTDGTVVNSDFDIAELGGIVAEVTEARDEAVAAAVTSTTAAGTATTASGTATAAATAAGIAKTDSVSAANQAIQAAAAALALISGGATGFTIIPPQPFYEPRYTLLDFTLAVTAPTGWTFARPDSTTCARFTDSDGKIKTVAANVMRSEYDPVTGKLLGYLHEAAATEILLQNETLTNPTWGTTAATVTGGTGVASPINGVDYFKLADTAVTSAHHLTQPATPVSGRIYVGALIARKADHDWFQLATGGSFGSFYVNYNLATGEVGNKGSTVLAAGMIPLGNGDYRCWWAGVATASSSSSSMVLTLTNNTNPAMRLPSYLGTGTGIYVVGANLRENQLSSHITTVASQVTRAADSLKTTQLGRAGYLPAEGSMMLEFRPIALPFSASTNPADVVLSLDDGTANNRTQLTLRSSDTSVDARITKAGVSVSADYLGRQAIKHGKQYRAILDWRKGESKLHVHGQKSTPSTVTVGYTPPTATTLAIGGNSYNGLENFCGVISLLKMFPERFTDESDNIFSEDPNNAGYVDFIIILGQSNADGRGIASSMSSNLRAYFQQPLPELMMYYKPAVRVVGNVNAGTNVDDGDWFSLGDTHVTSSRVTRQVIGDAASTVAVQSLTKAGCEQALAYLYSQTYKGRELRIIKFAVGGSGLNTDWGATNPVAGTLNDTFLNYVWVPAIADVVAQGKTPRIRLLWWMQGETDADNNVSQANYTTYLGAEVDWFNGALGYPIDKIAIGGLGNGAYNSTAGTRIKNAQVAVAAAKFNTVFVATDGSDGNPAIPLGGDTVHYTMLGQEMIAAKIWDLLVV